MSKMRFLKNKKWMSFFKSTAITRKITILYGGIFSLSLLIISFFLMTNAMTISEYTLSQELFHTMKNVEEFVKSGGVLTNENIESLLDNKYVEILVMDSSSNEVIKSSVGETPPFIDAIRAQINFHQPQENFTEGEASPTVIPPPFSFKPRNMMGVNYNIIVSENGPQFMVTENRFEYNQTRYFTVAYKMMGDQEHYFYVLALRLICIDVVGIFLSFLIGKYISSLILRPVKNIMETAERISIEDLSQRIDVTGPDDEMKELTITFNSMIERLDTSFQKQTQFISDASHELRTPISVIQGYANLINRWGKSDPSILQESIDSIIAETEHMSTLIKKLLLLAKGDQNKNHIQKMKMDLHDAAADIMRELTVMDDSHKIIYEKGEPVMIYGDPDLIKQLIWIMVENSIKYTPEEGGQIKLSIWKDTHCAYLSVSDNGVGIAAEDVKKIFDRFYRADKSRNKEIPGTGLGLSIAKWIMDIHGGSIQVESEVGKGSTFINQFPLYTQNQEDKKI